MAESGDGRPVCVSCGREGTVADLPGGWSLARDTRGTTALCPDCARRHVRDIEARLDP